MEQLGTVVAPSGKLVIVDAGMLWLWCHDRAPHIASEEDWAQAANSGVDLRVVGPDAEKLGRAVGLQWDPLYVFDIPRAAVEQVARRFADKASELKLDARVEPLERRVTHRERVELALQRGQGAGELTFHGLMACALQVPRGELRVTGQRMEEGRWRAVRIAFSDAAVARTEEIGVAAVDEARLIAVDADALAAWKHNEPLDGRCDVAFWGRDAEEIARENPAEKRGGAFLFTDLPLDEARARAEALADLRGARDLKFAIDLRPHSHHWQLMEQVRASPQESGVVQLGAARACGFMTTWGDGAFPVLRELDANGRTVGVRVDLGNEQIVARQRRFEELSKRAIVTLRALQDGVNYCYREPPRDSDDSGWCMFHGTETDDEANDPERLRLVSLRELVERDGSLQAVLDAEPGAQFERGGCEFQRVTA